MLAGSGLILSGGEGFALVNLQHLPDVTIWATLVHMITGDTWLSTFMVLGAFLYTVLLIGLIAAIVSQG